MMTLVHAIFAVAAMALQPADAPGPPAPSASAGAPQPQPPAPSDVIDKYKAQLEALSSDNPESYYLLGEEVADQAADVQSRRLAQQLFVLAFELARDRPVAGGRASLQAACGLALADLVKADHDRRWLVALARTLDPRRVPPEWLARQAPTTPDSAAYQVATVLGLVRAGQGGQARQLIERPEVKAALQAYDRLMTNMGMSGGADAIIREADRWPCPECQNERVVKRGNPPEFRLCPHCSGDPGPALSGRDFLAQLRFESLILQGSQRSWAAQITADSGAPLMDPDDAALAAAFDIDQSLVLWRDGKWAPDPNAPARAKPAPPAPPPPQNPPAQTPVTTNPTTNPT
jgi:hypothetical protein